MRKEKMRVVGLSLATTAATVVAVSLLRHGTDRTRLIEWFMDDWPFIVPAVAFIVGMIGGHFVGRRGAMRADIQRASKEQGLEPAALTDPEAAAAKKTAEQIASWSRDLKDDQKQKHGFRWAYAQRWLLVTGERATVTRLMPELATHGWLSTDEVILLWGGTGNDGRVDEDWLHRIRRFRYRRPLDAIVLVIDKTTLLSDADRDRKAWGPRLARIAGFLRWLPPVFTLKVDSVDPVHRAASPVMGCEFARSTDASAIEAALLGLRDRLADRSVHQLAREPRDRYAAELSLSLDAGSAPLARWVAGLSAWQRRPLPVAGAFFAPWGAGDSAPSASASGPGSDSVHFPLWRHLADAAQRTPGQRTPSHPVAIASYVILTFIGLWTAGMLFSAMSNARDVMLTGQALSTLHRAGNAPSRLRALLALQQRIGLHEARVQGHTPLFARFGLNHDRAVLDTLWTPYAHAAGPLLIAPAQQDLEGQLVDLGQMSTVEIDAQSSEMARNGQQALKTYLMMAEPERADAAFMAPQLAHHWNIDTGLSPGEKLDLSARLLRFWAEHFPGHPDWRIEPREDLVSGARQTLLAIIGVKNSEDTIYEGVIESVGRKYPDQTLASLTAGTDTRGVFSTTATVPGVFTREAWEGSIEAAIDAAAKRNGVAADWVLGDPRAATAGAARTMTADALRTALRAHYFSDYAEHWQDFMNGIRSEAAPTLPAAVGQLRLIADARQSPLIALLKSLAWQGGAGAQQASLSDALVTRAQNLLGKKDSAPQAAQPDPAGPLGASFGPVLKLVAQGNGNGNAAPSANSDVSLERFAERVMSLRLKLQQISDSADPDGEARQVAQSLFLGKGSALSDTLGYAQLVAASLGEQWAGMGASLFVRPVEQATQTVLAPAEASLNDAWRQTIVAAWNRSFAGRYPFASTANDASLPEFARFVRPQGGLISTFISTQLAGALQLQGDQWMPASGATGANGAARAFDPEFLKAINTLQSIAGHLLAQGEPQYAFGLKPVPTPGVTDTLLTLDGQTLHYYNQQESWQMLTWPSNMPQSAGTRIEWQTDTAGTNRSFEFGGRWALLRMLEHASVEPVDSATYQLTWVARADNTEQTPKSAAAKPDDVTDPAALTAQEPVSPPPANLTHPLRYLIRTDVGKGPLELLALKGFALPARIFALRASPGARQPALDGPPPLSRAALAAGKSAATSIPHGTP